MAAAVHHPAWQNFDPMFRTDQHVRCCGPGDLAVVAVVDHSSARQYELAAAAVHLNRSVGLVMGVVVERDWVLVERRTYHYQYCVYRPWLVGRRTVEAVVVPGRVDLDLAVSAEGAVLVLRGVSVTVKVEVVGPWCHPVAGVVVTRVALWVVQGVQVVAVRSCPTRVVVEPSSVMQRVLLVNHY